MADPPAYIYDPSELTPQQLRAAKQENFPGHGQKTFRWVSEAEQKSLRAEQAAAEAAGVGWKLRGPTGEDAPAFWRGQKYRPGSESYGNSGGKNKDQRAEYYKWLARYRKGISSAAEDARFLQVKSKGKGRGQGP